MIEKILSAKPDLTLKDNQGHTVEEYLQELIRHCIDAHAGIATSGDLDEVKRRGLLRMSQATLDYLEKVQQLFEEYKKNTK